MMEIANDEDRGFLLWVGDVLWDGCIHDIV